jgi:hypothetical protein
MNNFLGFRMPAKEFENASFHYWLTHVPDQIYDLKKNKIGVLSRIFCAPFFFFYPFYKILFVKPIQLTIIFFVDLINFCMVI